MAIDIADAEARLWAAADKLWANTGLKPSEFSTPVLGLIFLRYAETRFAEMQRKYLATGIAVGDIEKFDYQAEGVMYLHEKARFSTLLKLAEAEDLGKALNDAMAAIEADNEDLKGVLPRAYTRIENWVLVELLRLLAPVEIEGDAFGQIYEYFLGNFALKEGQKGGVFYTPTSIVKLIVEIIEPFHGRILDPACGSGGMFVQSAMFVQNHRKRAVDELTVFGTEKDEATVKLAKMNLAVHGLSGDIRQSNTYYEDPHHSAGKFDFVMANPPFNVSGVDKERIKGDPRFPLGMPSTDNANYLWISLFWASLNETGRAGFVMANSAGDARGSELEIRKKLIQSGAVDVIAAIGPNFFYTVTLPCTLWFLDKAKAQLSSGSPAGQQQEPSFPGLVEEAKTLRKRQLPADEALWELLHFRKLAGLHFRRRHKIGDYIVDFFCAEHGLVIEIDESAQRAAERQHHNARRDSNLRAAGHTVLRIPGQRVFDDTGALLSEIVQLSSRGESGEANKQMRCSDKVLFIDARGFYNQIDRAHRDFLPEQIEFLANIARLYRGEQAEMTAGSKPMMEAQFPNGVYRDIAGVCKVATLAEIEAQGWSLNPGRYVGVAERGSDGVDFAERLEELSEELEVLNAEARELEDQIAANVSDIIEATA